MIAIEQLEDEFSICKVADYSQVDLTLAYFFIGKTDEENSLLCPTNKVPENTLERNDGWKTPIIKNYTAPWQRHGPAPKRASMLLMQPGWMCTPKINCVSIALL